MITAVRNLNNTCFRIQNFRSCIPLKNRQKSDFITSSFREISIPNGVFPEIIFQSFDKCPKAIAVECHFTGKKYTFDDLRVKSRNFNTNLRRKLKLQKGDVVAILLPNSADFPICLFGACQAGLIVIPINSSFTSGEIGIQLCEANVKAVITLSSLYHIAREATKIAKMSIPVLTIKTKISNSIPEGAIDYNEFIESRADVDDIEVLPEDIAIMVYSSGTTGLPKGVQHTHRSIVANICQINTEEVRYFPIRSETYVNTHLAVIPWFTIYGMIAVLSNQLSLLTKLICIPKFTPEIFLNMIVKHRPTGLHLVPSLISLLANNPMATSESLQSIMTVVYGGAHLNKIDKNLFLNKANKEINFMNGYGLTETHGLCYAPLKRDADYGGGLKPLANTSVKIIDPDNNKVLTANQLGEILVKGPQVMKGYYKCPNETKKTFLDGWFKTGDVGYYDENGYVYISDRLKQIIKVNGFQVSPTEIENIIRENENVLETAVIGISDIKYGEVPLAFVVQKPNTRLNLKNLQQYVDSKLVSYKQLKGGVILLDNLPKTGSGKISRNHLSTLYQNNILRIRNVAKNI